MTNEEKDKKEYELAVLLKSEENLASVLSLLAEHHGETTSEPRAKRLGFAYEVKGIAEGVFASVTFKAYGDEVKALEHDLNLRQDVLRFLVIKTPAASAKTSAFPASAPADRHSRPARVASGDSKPAARPLSNEALEKKIEEILG